MKKEETIITLANEGMHNQKTYRKMKDMLNNNYYVSPRLYHIVMMGSEQSRDYQAAMKALCFELRRQDIPCQWKGCLEVDDEKGLHFHVFILAEAKHRNPCSILNHNAQHWLDVMMQKRELTFYIAPPANPIHRTRLGKRVNYATLAGEKLADCLVWISYLVKSRSKMDGFKRTYFGSQPSRVAAMDG
jgi:hypothetical protein